MVWVWRALFAMSVATTVYLMLVPLAAPPRVLRSADKMAHFAVFAVNGLLALPSFSRRRGPVLLGLVGLGVLLEGLQAAVPHRQPSLGDGIANAMGVVAAAAIGWMTRTGLTRGRGHR